VQLPRSPHPWTLAPRKAAAVQRRLAAQVTQRAPARAPRFVAGLDAAPSADGRACVGGVVLWDAETGEVVEERIALRPLRFPYVPGLLSFREAPALLAALRRLERPADVLVCDGHGLAHPRRFGIACHLGVATGLPAVGCAKSRLVGEHGEPGAERGARAPLLDRGEPIGAVVRTQPGVRPVYVSVGHRVDLDTAVEWVLRWVGRHRLPEPTRRADRLVAAFNRPGAAPRTRAARRARRAPSRAAPPR
jgi:deoxyribonuclease V